jgi:hypothetical protein
MASKNKRTLWGQQFDTCMVCGIHQSQLVWLSRLHTHEMARGPHRAAAMLEPAAWLRVCTGCHMGPLAAMPIVRQLAIKKIQDHENYDRVTVNRIRGRQPDAITEAEVDAEVVSMLLLGEVA